MKKSVALAAAAVAGVASGLSAQTVTPNPAGYTYEFRIIADGDAGAPSGSWSQLPLSTTATAIGFWIQARVAQTINQNWGITRVSPPAAPNTSFLTVTDSVGSSLNRGTVNAAGTNFGRGSGYRSGGPATGATGNAGGSAAFPGITNNQNGAIDQGGTRIYSYDAYVGFTRDTLDQDNGTNPWAVNGAAGSAAGGTPVPSNGTFSPWANIYRFVVLPTNSNAERTITLDAYALVQGAVQAAPTDGGTSGSTWTIQLAPGRQMATQYSFQYGIPTPGAAALLGLGGLAVARRRR